MKDSHIQMGGFLKFSSCFFFLVLFFSSVVLGSKSPGQQDVEYEGGAQDMQPQMNDQQNQDIQEHFFSLEQTASSIAQQSDGSAFETGFYPFPIFGLDYDKNRKVFYLGLDKNPEGVINEDQYHYNGPFAVVDSSYLHGNLAVIFSPFIGVAGIFGGPGLGGYAYKQLEVIRVVENLEEVKKLKKVKKFPKNTRDLRDLPNGSVLSSTVSGAVTLMGKAVVGYVVAAGPEVVVSGSWIVRVIKKSDYEVVVVLKKINEKSMSLSTSVITSYMTSKKSKIDDVGLSFEISLESDEGCQAYNEIMKGRVAFVQKMASSSQSSVSYVDDRVAQETIQQFFSSEMKGHHKSTALKLGLPILMSWNRNFGSRMMTSEQTDFLSCQDQSTLGSIPEGTHLESVLVSCTKGTHTQGLLTKHRAKLRQYQAQYDRITLPESVESCDFDNLPEMRAVVSFTYGFQKDRVSEKTWVKQLKKMALRTGYKRELLSAVAPVLHKKASRAEFEAKLKISLEALHLLHIKLNDENEDGDLESRIVATITRLIDSWAEDAENVSENLYRMGSSFRRKMLKSSKKVVSKSLRSLQEIPFQDISESNEDLSKALGCLTDFLEMISENQFVLHGFLKEFLDIRDINPLCDLAFSVRWKGSDFRRGEKIFVPSLLREDHNKSYLKYETDINPVPMKQDYELFEMSY